MDGSAYRLLTEAAAAATPARAVVRVRGEKPLAFLHDVASQELAGLTPGQGALTCFLDEKGRVQAEARALVLDDGSVLLDAEPAALGYLTGWLARIAPLSGCEIDDGSSSWHFAAVRGPRAAEMLGIGDALDAEHRHIVAGDRLIVRVDWGLPGFDVLSTGRVLLEQLTDLDTFEAARVAAGRPRFGVDVTPEMLVNETPLLHHAVAIEKGCYPGQESVARVRNLGRVRRMLVGLRFDAPGDPAASTPVLHDAEQVGVVTSGARLPDGAAAIAHVRAEVAPGTLVEAGGEQALVVELV